MINAAALAGHTEDGEPIAILALEAPSKIHFGGRRLTKRELERVHLEKYRLDMLIATGVLPFDGVTEGGNPPDFIVTTPWREEGIECAAFALQKRRDAYGLFDRFRARLLEARQREGLPHLADCVISVWFGSGGGLPPKTHDQATVDQLVEMLREARIDRAGVSALSQRIAREGFPESLADESVPIFSAGEAGGACIAPVEPNSLQGPYAQAAGFDVGLSMSLTVTRSDVQTELERIVEKHDKPGVDRLLISVGAPDRGGLIFPSESLVIDQLAPAPVTIKHIRVVTMHTFLTGGVRELS